MRGVGGGLVRGVCGGVGVLHSDLAAAAGVGGEGLGVFWFGKGGR